MRCWRRASARAIRTFPTQANVLRVMIGETTARRRSDHRHRARSQYRRLDAAGAGLRDGAAVRSRRARRHADAGLHEEEPAGHADFRDRGAGNRGTAGGDRCSPKRPRSGVRIYRRPSGACWRASIAEVETPYGKVRVKYTDRGGFAPEYEDCRRLAAEQRRAAAHGDRRSRTRHFMKQYSDERILPHDSDLLRECRAAHRARLHHHRRRHHRALQAHAGLRRRADHRHRRARHQSGARGAARRARRPENLSTSSPTNSERSGRSSICRSTASSAPRTRSTRDWCNELVRSAARRTATSTRAPTRASTAVVERIVRERRQAGRSRSGFAAALRRPSPKRTTSSSSRPSRSGCSSSTKRIRISSSRRPGAMKCSRS